MPAKLAGCGRQGDLWGMAKTPFAWIVEPPQLDNGALAALIGSAERAIGRLDAFVSLMPCPDHLLTPLRIGEAVLSSRIEGSRTTVDSMLDGSAMSSDDDLEAKAYLAAMTGAEISCREELNLEAILEAHRVLMEASRRGGRASPGMLRTVPVWIGRGGSIETATYVPPPAEEIRRLLDTAIGEAGRKDEDPLVSAALFHARFELIHPFRDGNGRIGRMFVPILLMARGAVRRPFPMVSRYLESNREDYYLRLQGISKSGDWNGWTAWFLEALRIQADADIDLISSMIDLREELLVATAGAYGGRAPVPAVDGMFSRPVFTIPEIAGMSGIPERTLRRFVGFLASEGIVEEIAPGSGNQAALFRFTRLMALLRSTY